MSGETAIGPEGKPAPAGSDRADQAAAKGVDAQDANERDMRSGLAGAEAKPFAPAQASAKAGASESAAVGENGRRPGTGGHRSPGLAGEAQSREPKP